MLYSYISPDRKIKETIPRISHRFCLQVIGQNLVKMSNCKNIVVKKMRYQWLALIYEKNLLRLGMETLLSPSDMRVEIEFKQKREFKGGRGKRLNRL